MSDNLLIFTIKIFFIINVILLRIKCCHSTTNHDRFKDYNDDVVSLIQFYLLICDRIKTKDSRDSLIKT